MKVSEISISYRNEIPFDERQKITSSRDAEKIFREFIGSDTIGLSESFVVALLDRANSVLGVVTISSGGLAGCIADPKLIYSIALKAVAHGIIVCHNHPSGNLKASSSDIDLTKRLKDAGKFLELPLMDHIILSPEADKYFSFADNGML